MKSAKCQILGHEERKINAICFGKECKGKRVCCQLCQLKLHNDHADQLVESDFVVNFIRTVSKEQVVLSREVSQAIQELTQVQNDLNDFQKLIQKEIQRLNSQSLQQFCKDIGNHHHIPEGQVQGLENEKFNELAEDMLKNFQVQEGKIILKHSFVNELGQQYLQFMNQYSQTMIKIVKELKLINEIFKQKDENNKKIRIVNQNTIYQATQQSQLIPRKEIYYPKVQKTYFEAFTEQKVLTGHTACVRGIDICKQRNLLASGGDDKNVKLWDLNNHQLIKTYTHSGIVYDVVFSNQGNLLAFAGDGCDNSIKLIDISDLKKYNVEIDLKGHTHWIYRLTFSNDSKYLISGSYDQKIIFWDVILKKESFQLNSESCVQSVAINSDDTLITSNSDDGKIRIWTIQNPKLLCTQQAHTNGAGIKFSNDKKMLASSGYDGTIKLWSLEKANQSQLLLIREFKAATKCIWTVLFSPCSGFIICMSNQDREIKVLDSLTGEVVKLFKSKATNGNDLIQVAISKDMDIIAYGENTNIAVWTRK